MFNSRSLRLAAPRVKHERLHSHSQLSGARSYSINVRKPTVPRHRHHRPRLETLRASCSQQTRSLSLFGWGSSKSMDAGFSEGHSTQQAGSSQQPVYEKWDAGTVSSTPTPINAVHSTTDTPATPTLPHTPEPQVLREIENTIAAPHLSPSAEPLLSAEQELFTMPERIGYLKEVCGLDYGWGPTAFMEFVVEHLHIYGGLTWAASIAGSAVLIRLLAFRPSCQSSDLAVRMKQAGPVLKPLQKEYKEATLAKDTVKQAQVAGQIKMIMQEYNIRYGKIFLPMLIQIPLSFGGFRLYRGMAALPVPAFEAEQWLWVSDLTQSDPLYMLPLISAASLYVSMRLGTETGAGPMQGALGQLLKVALPLTSGIFVYFQPGALQIFFATQSLLSMCQTFMLRNALVRTWLGLLPLPPKVVDPVEPTAPGGLRTWQDPSASRAPDAPTNARRNTSVVDRYVDAAKGRYTNMKESVLGKDEEREAARKKDNYISKAEKYELTRRQQAEWERENRNKNKITSSSDDKGVKR